MAKSVLKDVIAKRNDVEDIKNSIASIKIFVRSQEQRDIWERLLKENGIKVASNEKRTDIRK